MQRLLLYVHSPTVLILRLLCTIGRHMLLHAILQPAALSSAPHPLPPQYCH